MRNSAVDGRPVARRRKSSQSTMKSIKEYPKATKIEIPLTLSGLTRYFNFVNSAFITTTYFDQTAEYPLVFVKPTSQLYTEPLTTRSLVIRGSDEIKSGWQRFPRPRTLTVAQSIGERAFKDVATLTLDVSGPVPLFVITLLVPVSKLGDRTILFIDYLRAVVPWQNTQPPTGQTGVYVKGVREMMLMKKALIDRGLAEDAAQDQAMRTLLPADLTYMLRSDAEGGSADARKRGNLLLRLIQEYILKHKAGGTRRRRKL